jgi:LuxR family maltose regulon positive regulatory protein
LDLDSASAWLSSQLTESVLEPSPISEGWILEIAYVLEALERREAARALIQKIIQFAQGSGRTHTLIRAKTALALVDHQPQALVEALELAEPEGYFSTFIDEGKPMQNLLNHLSNQSHLSPKLSLYVGKLLSEFEPAPRKPRQSEGMVEPLSEREVEVLLYMSKGLSNPEIARRLYLSPNTLKAHTQNIFMKLDVHNRLEAVSKARELGLIP